MVFVLAISDSSSFILKYKLIREPPAAEKIAIFLNIEKGLRKLNPRAIIVGKNIKL